MQDMTQAPGTKEVDSVLGSLNRRRSYPMSAFERRAMEEGRKKPFYIYSVNPIHEWDVQQGQLGIVKIRKREEGKRVSEPTIIPGVVARQYDKGLGKKEWFMEEGRDIIEDILGCSERFPPPTQENNLLNFGVFFTEKPFEDLPAKEQSKLIEAATQKMIIKLQALVLSADRLHAEGHGNWISQINRDALQHLNDISGGKEERPWAPIRLAGMRIECPECGHMNKSHVRICYNCKFRLDGSRVDVAEVGQVTEQPRRSAHSDRDGRVGLK